MAELAKIELSAEDLRFTNPEEKAVFFEDRANTYQKVAYDQSVLIQQLKEQVCIMRDTQSSLRDDVSELTQRNEVIMKKLKEYQIKTACSSPCTERVNLNIENASLKRQLQELQR